MILRLSRLAAIALGLIGPIGPIVPLAASLACSSTAIAQCGFGGSCCTPHLSPGCNDLDCCEAVCAVDSFCCTTEWDNSCASQALDMCFTCGGVCGEVGNCCQGHVGVGCADDACCNTVCTIDPECCYLQWDTLCADTAVDLCASCGNVCGSGGDCCTAHPETGCNDEACCNAVCSIAPLCCSEGWDSTCVAHAIQFCGECPSGCGGAGSCCVAHASPGCSDVNCCEEVCAVDPFCCNSEWDAACADEAFEFCASCGGVCGGEGDCCTAHVGVGCSDDSCCLAVCAVDPTCCSQGWDNLCASQAEDLCDSCAGNVCGTGGNCCVAHAGPGCSNATCCGLVCNQDPSCCNSEWDAVCALQAEGICSICQGSTCGAAGDCCVVHANPGCIDVDCCEVVCAVDPSCCSVSWDSSCVSQAIDACNGCGTRGCPGDLNGNNAVDGGDITVILGEWGPAGGFGPADLDDNGTVDGADLTFVLGVWGACP